MTAFGALRQSDAPGRTTACSTSACAATPRYLRAPTYMDAPQVRPVLPFEELSAASHFLHLPARHTPRRLQTCAAALLPTSYLYASTLQHYYWAYATQHFARTQALRAGWSLEDNSPWWWYGSMLNAGLRQLDMLPTTFLVLGTSPLRCIAFPPLLHRTPLPFRLLSPTVDVARVANGVTTPRGARTPANTSRYADVACSFGMTLGSADCANAASRLHNCMPVLVHASLGGNLPASHAARIRLACRTTQNQRARAW